MAIDRATGKLHAAEPGSSTGGPGPRGHLIVDATGKTLLVANYAGGSFASFPIMADASWVRPLRSFRTTDRASIRPGRASRMHTPSICRKSNKIHAGADLGTDKVMIFRLDAANAKITPSDPPSASVKPGLGAAPYGYRARPEGMSMW